MIPKFRLEDIDAPVLSSEHPETTSVSKIEPLNVPYKRCDCPPTNCAGCDCAALKSPQADTYQSEAA